MKYKILLCLFAISFLASAMLAIPASSTFCLKTHDGKAGCDVVAASSHSKILGFSNAYIGILAFGILTIFSAILIRKQSQSIEWLVYLGVFFSAIVSAYFLYLQAFVISAYCTYCLVIDLSSIISLGVVLYFEVVK